jgi:3'-5' exoribonuclease
MHGEPTVESHEKTRPRGRVWVRDLRRGDRVQSAVLLVETANFKQTRNQKFFIQMSLRDRSGAIRAIRWDADEDLYGSFRVDDFVRVSGRVEEFQQSLQLIVDGIEKVDPLSVDYNEFLPTAAREISEMERALREAVGRVTNEHLRALLARFVDDPALLFAISHCPAGKTLHHAYIGGLLSHILSLVELTHKIADSYPRLNRDLLVAGAILHDIGKIEELGFTRNFSYTDAGQLIGHVGLGLLIVDRKAREVPGFPESLLIELEHIVASHHGLLEYGALKQPMTPEAFAFHYLDNLDAKMATLDAVEDEFLGAPDDEVPAAGRWSDYKAHLGRKLYFPGAALPGTGFPGAVDPGAGDPGAGRE